MTTATRTAGDLKSTVLTILQRHVGQDYAILSLDLAEAVGLPRTKASQRKLQIIIRELRAEHKPVLSTCSPPYGYFYPLTRTEGLVCLQSLKSRLIEDAKTKRDIKIGLGYYFEPAEKARLL